jgi:hypothetical protein
MEDLKAEFGKTQSSVCETKASILKYKEDKKNLHGEVIFLYNGHGSQVLVIFSF